MQAPLNLREHQAQSQDACLTAASDAHACEGSLRVRLIGLDNVHIGGQLCSGEVYVQLACDTYSQTAQCYQSPCVQLISGCARFDDFKHYTGRSVPVSGLAGNDAGVDFDMRKVPPGGIVRLSLHRAVRFGFRTIAHASLHLDAIAHVASGGDDLDHVVPWQTGRGGGEALGAIAVKAFWTSTVEDRLEMQLVTLQVSTHTHANAPSGWKLTAAESNETLSESAIFRLDLMRLHCHSL